MLLELEKAYSQVGQDIWVAALLGPGRTYLDIGAGDPQVISNTYALERRGWTGILCDIEHEQRLRAERKAVAVYGDAFSVDWDKAIASDRVDYLSLDLEPPELTLRALCALPLDRVRFSAITIEHDSYRGKMAVRKAMRGILSNFGYELVAPDICVRVGDITCPFEDWWVDPETVAAYTAAYTAAAVRMWYMEHANSESKI
jgi:hypothetical protein